jgi:hypothetical protein
MQPFFFIVGRNHFVWPMTNCFWNIWHTLKIELHRCFSSTPFYNLYTWKFDLGQNIWNKSVVILGTYWQTHWELDRNLWKLKLNGNTLGTPKKKVLPPTPNPKGKKLCLVECIFSLLIGHMKITVLKLSSTIFEPRLIPLPNNVGTYWYK